MANAAFREFLAAAKNKFKLAEEAEHANRILMLRDLEFCDPDEDGEGQWDQAIKQARIADGRPCLTINQIKQKIRIVVNEQRQASQGMKVIPVDNAADPETAKVIQGILRHIEANSQADIAYQTGFEYAAKMGIGFWRVLTDYVEDESFDQEILIRRIDNPFCVYFDPAVKLPDYSDAEWCFIVTDMEKEAYKQAYPQSSMAGLSDWASVGDQSPGWASDSSCRVAEHFYFKRKERELLLFDDGTKVFRDPIPPDMTELPPIKDTRAVMVKQLHWCKFNAVEKLDERELPGKYIPVIPVIGDEVNINGKRILSGMVRAAKDPQRMFNYWASAKTEAIALAPKAPWIVAEGQLEGHEKEWREANVRNFPYLKYKPVSSGGQVVGPPQRQAVEPPIQAMVTAEMQAADYIKVTTGVYDASVGAQGNETSGKAIAARQSQSSLSNLNFSDNNKRAIRHTTRVVLDLIPKIYDARTVARIIGDDGTADTVELDPQQEGARQEYNTQDGIKSVYNVLVGKYDVVVDSEPSYRTKRQEAVAMLTEVFRGNPDAFNLMGDIALRNMDFDGAREAATRLKKMLPPPLQENLNGPQIPQEAKMMMESLQKQLEELNQYTQQLEKEKEAKQWELASKERIEASKNETQVQIETMRAESREDVIRLEAKFEAIQNHMDRLNDRIIENIKAEAKENQPEPATQ